MPSAGIGSPSITVTLPDPIHDALCRLAADALHEAR